MTHPYGVSSPVSLAAYTVRTYDRSGTALTASATSPVASATGLHKRFGSLHAVNDVSLHINPGETYGLLGPNGAGKTTTISILSGLLEADQGTVTVGGTTIKPSSPQGKASIGLVPQDLAIYPDLTADENLRFFASLYGMPAGKAKQRIDQVLDVIELTDRRKDRTQTYSGGMKRRLNIGIGLLHEPALLVLDEPTVGVDPQSRNAILEAVERLSGEGMAVLYTTHYMEEAERLCDRIGIIDNGQIIAQGSRAELVAGLGEADRVRIEVSGDPQDALEPLRAVAGVQEATAEEQAVTILVDRASERLSAVVSVLAQAGVQIGSIDVAQPDLEAVFLNLTGKALRE